MLNALAEDRFTADQIALLSALTQRQSESSPSAELPVVWPVEQDLITAGHSPETVELLIATGVALRWQIPGAPVYLVLTPWGAWIAKVTIRERWIVKEVETAQGPAIHAYEVPCWIERPSDDHGDPMAVAGPIHQLRHANECRLPFPERVPDPKAGPEYLADTETGETTRNVAKATRLFCADGEKPGIPITIDPRIRGKRPPKAKRSKRRRTA